MSLVTCCSHRGASRRRSRWSNTGCSWHPERSNGFTKVMKIDRSGGPLQQHLVDTDEQHPNDPNQLNPLRITQGGTHLSWNTHDGPIPVANEPTFE